MLGQSVVVDNRGGAGGSLGTAAIAKAPPDGYTIGMGTASTLAINPAAYKNLPFDVLTDLTPIGNIAAVPNIMAIHPAVAADDHGGVHRAGARASPASCPMPRPATARSGTCSASSSSSRPEPTSCTCRIAAWARRSTTRSAGQVQVIYDNLPTSLQLVQERTAARARRCRASKRAEALPNVPTFGELGLDDVNWMAFFGLIAPKDTPAPIVRRLNEALVRVLAMPDVRARLSAQQAIVVGNSPEAFKAEIARELARMRRAVSAARIELN